MEELSCATVFSIGNIGISESTVVSWILMAVLTIISIIGVRNLKVENPGKIQILLETFISWADGFFESIAGETGKKYTPYFITVLLYIGASNLCVLVGFKPPTKDMNVTAGLAIASMILIEYVGFKSKGFAGKLKSFAEPMPLILPINIMEVVMRPVSLCMRLFGNILGGFVVMELIKLMVPLLVPIPFSFYFDIFDGLIQAYVFVFLTALFVGEAAE